MSRRNRSLFGLSLQWGLAMLASPLLLLQGWWVRRTALRLPEAKHPNTGQFGEGDDVIGVIGLGDSVIAGVGIEQLSDSVIASYAGVLHQQTGRPVSWRAEGTNGHKLVDLLGRLRDIELRKAHVIVVSIGVNDVTALTGMGRWQMQLIDLLAKLRAPGKRSIIMLGVPPMEYFVALPQPLRWVLGIRAALLDYVMRELVSVMDDVQWIDVSGKFDMNHLARDGYHPNEIACQEMAEQISLDIRLPEVVE